MNLPNALTLLRIFLVPVLVVVLLTRAEGHVFLGTAIFALAVITDYLDGYLARRRNEVTRLGILLDPLADKLLTAAAFLSLVELDAVPAWMVMIILGREFVVTGLRNVAAGRGLLIPASGLGKSKMVAQVVSIFLLLLGRKYSILQAPGMAVLWLVVVLAFVSAVDYFRRFWREALKPMSRPVTAPAEATPEELPSAPHPSPLRPQ
ncbi:MAG: CDP-diacylglycerol--glycerol-3-phosphate 3-phosphatidyltransferase [Acidobacteria bacterium]|nr:MAG: CDP-diacylglycerol--glycerol-3-phosphate 3-phosphatidyltransferase [Acidobacteriota bacterium]PYQ22314.1 MAG: CDP-diacylglycerol--glycerol-3-phosphate 3-phosphatidyltransferase [Acidobacteriota bacterium]